MGGFLTTASALTARSARVQTQAKGGRRSVRRPHRVQNSVVARDDALVKPSARPNVLLSATNAVFPFMQLPYRPVGNDINAGIQVTMLTVGHKVFVVLNVTHHFHVVTVRHSLNDDSDFL